jgi:hypothetical protein
VKPDGTTCDDHNACTVGESCHTGTCSTGAPSLCSAPLHWWSGDGTALDHVAGLNLGLQNIQFAAGEVQQAFAFAGGWAEVPFAHSGPVTVDFWVRTDNPNQPRYTAVLASSRGAQQPFFQIELDGNGHYQFQGGNDDLDLDIGPAATTYEHVAVTYDGTTVRTYMNGVAVASGTWPLAGPLQFEVVRLGQNRSGGLLFTGDLDEVHLFDRALSSDEVSSIYRDATAGLCAGAGQVDCDDHNPCTADSCDPVQGCLHTPVIDGVVGCDDGNACTRGDLCSGGQCVSGAPVVCAASDQCHTAGVCDPATGACSVPAVPDQTPCNDGNACSTTDVCIAGACRGANWIVCNPSDGCHDVGTCNPATGACTNPAAPDGISCTDGNACTQSDSCQTGACVGANPVVCRAIDQCHTVGVCDTTTGSCSNPMLADGTTCNDGDACTRTDTCSGGTCVGSSPVVCAALDPCHLAGACDPTSGLCSNPTRVDGSTCDDGNACTTGDHCSAGACAGAPKTCTALDSCHVPGTCDPATGSCSNPPKPGICARGPSEAVWSASTTANDRIAVLQDGSVLAWASHIRYRVDGTPLATPLIWPADSTLNGGTTYYGSVGTELMVYPDGAGGELVHSSFENKHTFRTDGTHVWSWIGPGCCDFSEIFSFVRPTSYIFLQGNYGQLWHVNGLNGSDTTHDGFTQSFADTLERLVTSGSIGYRTGTTSLASLDPATGATLFLHDYSASLVGHFVDGAAAVKNLGFVFAVSSTGAAPWNGMIVRDALTSTSNGDSLAIGGATSNLVVDQADAFVGVATGNVGSCSLVGVSTAGVLTTRWSVSSDCLSAILLGDDGGIYTLGSRATASSDVTVFDRTGAVTATIDGLPGDPQELLLRDGHLYVKTTTELYRFDVPAQNYSPTAPWPTRKHDNGRTAAE